MLNRIRVRMLQTVTMVPNPPWPAGSVQTVTLALARTMVDAGEAVLVGTTYDATYAVGVRPMRVRDG